MAFSFTVNKNPEEVKDRSTGNFITKSGMYPIRIKAVIYEEKDNGSAQVHLYFEHNNQAQIIYNAWTLTKKDGSDNEVGRDGFNKFCIITNAPKEINPPISMQLPIGKNNELKDCLVLPDFTDTQLTILLKMDYSIYEDKIRENKVIRNMFQAGTFLTASEIVNNVTSAKQYQKELANAELDVYKDGLTKEVVDEWIKNGRNSNNTIKPTTEAKKPSTFNGKRKFGGSEG